MRGRETLSLVGEDTYTAVLYRESEAAMRPDLTDASALDTLLALLVRYEPLEVLNFCKAIEQFSVDVLHLAGNLRTELPPHCA